MTTGLYYSPLYLEHVAPGHPESPTRLETAWTQLQRYGLTNDLAVAEPPPADLADVERVHTPAHVRRVRAIAADGGGWVDGDTFVAVASYGAALCAAGAGIAGCEAVLSGRQENAFALVRPPGHHALPDRAMGFCLFNNVAIAAAWARAKGGAERVLIVDFDVHHGNGTQDVFYDRADVALFSTHQFPLYPGTGRLAETGTGAGAGYSVNLPLPPGCGDGVYLRAFDEVLAPLARRYRPDLILVSAGYDAHWSDPLANMRLTVDGYVALVERLRRLADELCGGRLVALLEGGYNLGAVAAAVVATCQVLADQPPIGDPLGTPPPEPAPRAADDVLAAARELHHLT
ncbi:MAG TPA: histone deacetylase [Chloroflexota bacterium]|jgi:acetoin utilization deacetylase AcuC-like enzyme